jgi:hypothetical protein
MPANIHLMSGLGGGGVFVPARSCPVAGTYGGGSYMSHQGGDGDYMIADARTRTGTAAVRIVAWRCVHCGLMCVGIGYADGDPETDQEFTGLEEQVVLLGADGAGRTAG